MKKIAVLVFGTIIISACATTATGAQIGSPYPEQATQTAMHKPTRTPMSTKITTTSPTIIPTLVPRVTPSQGPAPDLELTTVSIKSKDRYNGWIYGELRNNTDQVMVFPVYENGMHLLIDYHDWYVDQFGNGHAYWRSLDMLVDLNNNQRMSCYLFPGEIGVFSLWTGEICSLTESSICRQSEKSLVQPPAGEGFQILGYDASYRTWEELKNVDKHNIFPDTLSPNLHPQAENVEFELKQSDSMIEGDAILIQFDVDFINPGEFLISGSPLWAVLYDASGSIINVLYSPDVMKCADAGCPKDGRYHLVGAGCNREKCLFANWAEPGQKIDWFQPKEQLTNADLQRVDHIRLFIEIQNIDICHEYFQWQEQ